MAGESNILKGKFYELAITQKFLCVGCQNDLEMGKCKLWNSKLFFVGIYDKIDDLRLLCNGCCANEAVEFLKKENKCEHNDFMKIQLIKLENKALLTILNGFDLNHLRQLKYFLFGKIADSFALVTKNDFVFIIKSAFTLEYVLAKIALIREKTHFVHHNKVFSFETASVKPCKNMFNWDSVDPFKQSKVNCLCCQKEHHINLEKCLFYNGNGEKFNYVYM